MPIGDWQFWLVTLAALGGLVLLVRAVVPWRRRSRRSRRVPLTIEKRRS